MGQAAEHQQVVLRGVVVARGQLAIEQVGQMQVDQPGAAQRLQAGLDLGLHGLELAPLERDPDEAACRQPVRQGRGFADALLGEMEDAHAAIWPAQPCWRSRRAASRAK